MHKGFVAASLVLFAACVQAAPKYVFLFIGDGMSIPQRMVAEEFAEKVGHGELAMNRLPYQVATRTKSADAIITDSAAAATAIACGKKTCNGMLGVDPLTNRLESVAVLAQKSGRKVGIMTTVTICHATPAGFYAHRPSRGLYYQIGLDLVSSGFDLFAGGGLYRLYDNRKDPYYRGDIRDLARAAGYTIATNRAEWAALKPGGKSWTIFGEDGMAFDLDRDGTEPLPCEMVSKAIELLDNPNGFFIMFEGGKVDYAGHANDAASNLRDVLALDNAVKVALAFQEKHPNDTLVITTGDHETGGMSMGFAGCGGAFKVELLKNQRISSDKFSNDIKKLIADRAGEITFAEIQPTLTAKFGFRFPQPLGYVPPAKKGEKPPKADPMDVTESEYRTLETAFLQDVENVRIKKSDTKAHDVKRTYAFSMAVKDVLAAKAGVGWSSWSHTALPTLTTAKGAEAQFLVGIIENSDLGTRLKELYRK